jgi:hypothetical protein
MRILPTLLLAAAVAAAAQSVPVSAPTPLTNTRYAAVRVQSPAKVATNGRTFVAAWTANNLVRVSRIQTDGSAGVGLPIDSSQDPPAIATAGDGYVVATTRTVFRDIYLHFLDENGRPTGNDLGPVASGFNPQLVANGSVIALFFGGVQANFGKYEVVLLDSKGKQILRQQATPPEIVSINDFAAATNGTSFQLVYSDSFHVYANELDASGGMSPRMQLYLAPTPGRQLQVSVASNGHNYLAAWSTDDGKLAAATIAAPAPPPASTIIATPSAGAQILRPRAAWNGTRYVVGYLDGSSQSNSGTPRFAEIGPQITALTPRDLSAASSYDLSLAGTLATWTTTRGELLGTFINGTATNQRALTLGAAAEEFPAAASNGASTLVAWIESATDGASLRAGISGPDRSWTELGALAPIVNPPPNVNVATDGSNYLVVADKSAIRIGASGAVLDAAPIALPFSATGAAWDGRAYVLVGDSDTTVVAMTLSPSGVVGAVRQIRAKSNAESSGNARVAGSGDGSLVTFTRIFYGFPVQPSPSAAVAIDHDLEPRTAEVPLIGDTTVDTAVAWNGSQYLVIGCDAQRVWAWSFNADGVRIGLGVVIDDLGYGNVPVGPGVAATSSGWAIGWRVGKWEDWPRQDGYVMLLHDDMSVASSPTIFDKEIVFGPLFVARAGETDIVASAFRSAVPYYGALRVDAFRIGAAAPPPAPRLSAQGALLEWTPVSGATGYRVQTRGESGEWMELPQWFAPSQTSVTVDGGKPAAYRVRALGAGGVSGDSNEVIVGGRRRVAR